MHLDLAGEWRRSISGKTVDYLPIPGCYPPVGECDLTRAFPVPADFLQPHARYFLVTEGVLAHATFTLNDLEFGPAGPFVPYRFELPPDLLREANTLTAHVRDIPEPFGTTPGRRYDAGLIRPIYVERRPAAFLQTVDFQYELADDYRSVRGTVCLTIDGPVPTHAEVLLRDLTTGEEARLEGDPGKPISFDLLDPHLWSLDRPHLYSLEVTLAGDDQPFRDTVGFRKLEIKGSDFYLNGARLLLKGVCRHEFTPDFGYTVPEDVVRRDLERIKAAGFNYIRLVHSPQAACVCRLAAEIGLLVSEEPGACWHNLADPDTAARALDTLGRMVLRDRTCPAVFAWLLYNECPPVEDYAVQAAGLSHELQPGCLVSMADSSFKPELVKPMVQAAGLSYYGINRYGFDVEAYTSMMDTYTELPLVFTEWGGWWSQGNRGVVKSLGKCFHEHALPEGLLTGMAGFSLWVWQDYNEFSRPEPCSVDGVTIEGLIDMHGKDKPDLLWLSELCFELGREPLLAPATIEVLSPDASQYQPWQPLPLPKGDQSALDARVEETRARFRYTPPPAPTLRVAGIDFTPREGSFTTPLLLGPGQEEIIIPVHREVRALALLGHVSLFGGYPGSNVWSVYHADQEPLKQLGQPASHYDLVFEDGTETIPLRHGLEILRANDLCRWWHTNPRSPHTAPAARATLHPSFEILRYDLWQHDVGHTRVLKEIRWKLDDKDSIQAMLALSVAG